ncbi:MAG: hypothetical protein RBS86_03025 [Candidatus Moranbacteria bacterium]|jgi:hypothetical protein|nr:hypothetical protein [Candidatus Moranbacteria bacterium]
MFIIEQILFYLSLIIILFLPGYFLLLAIFGKDVRKIFLPLENFTISFGLSLIAVNFLIIILGKTGIPITTLSISAIIGFFLTTCYLFYKNKNKKNKVDRQESIFADFSKKQSILIILIIFLTVFIKTAYLKDAIFPTSTDLGHHMYWAKLVSETGNLPDYEKLEIIEDEGNYFLEKSDIADFIIGEHLVFSAINLLSGADFISYFPTLVLFLIDIIGILAIFILTLRIFSRKNFITPKSLIKNPLNISITALLLMGPIYAISSPQAKFVSGGVVGNIIGNLLIPLSLYLFFRALKEENKNLMTLALFASGGMFYFHHLSSLIFIFIFIFIILFFTFASLLDIAFLRIKENKSRFSDFSDLMKKYFKIAFSAQNIVFLAAISIFVLFIHTPSYLNFDATSTAVGAPSKSTRTGLTPAQFKYAVGEPRLALGLIGIFLLSLIALSHKNFKKKNTFEKILAPAFIIGWTIALSVMTLKPHWLYINIPSGRVANYTSFPFVISASFALVWLAYFIKNLKGSGYFSVSSKIILLFFFLMTLTVFSSGHYDNSQSLSGRIDNQSALETFHASGYLTERIDSEIMTIKDHNYIKADAWMKLSFMRDYSYPLSRGFFKRYEDPTKPREMCTLWMIESPSSEKAQRCYAGTGTRFVVINPEFDSIQFEKNDDFWKIYSGKHIEIFYRH